MDADTPLYIPAHPGYPADGERQPQIIFELLQDAEGGPVPVAFTTLGKLVAARGTAQPWTAVAARRFVELMRAAGFGPVRLDPEVDPDAPRWQPQDAAAYTEGLA